MFFRNSPKAISSENCENSFEVKKTNCSQNLNVNGIKSAEDSWSKSNPPILDS